MKNILKTIPILLLLISCDNYFKVDTDDALLDEDNYQKRSEIYSGFIGLASVFQDIAGQTLLLSELRSDMMEPTENAPGELWDIHEYVQTEDNPYIAPDLYYKVILNANNFIRSLIKVKAENPEIVADNIYNGMISQALGFRNWCYLTIGKIYGEAAWHDLSLSDVIDATQIPVIKFDALIDELISSMKIGIGDVDAFNDLSWSDHILNNADYSWNRVPVKANALMAELYLWKGEYQNAIEYAMRVINETTETDKFKISSLYQNGSWQTMISTPIGGAISERLTVIPFSYSEQQQCEFQLWLSNKYYLRGTKSMAERFERQIRTDNGSGDRYRGSGVTYRESGNDYIINKYLIGGRNSYQADAPIIIYRSADVHFILIEALNRLELFEEAMIFLNDGAIKYWSNSAFLPPLDNPLFPNAMQGNVGIRGRVSLKAHDNSFLKDASYTSEMKMQHIDALIAEEVAMESAYEGKRLFTLMRMARYWDNPEIVANPISEKFIGQEKKYKNYLMNPDNWYIKVNHTGK